MKALTKEVKIALVAIAGVIILFFGMNFLKGLNLFSSTDDYFIEFKDISGLSSSCPIYADGFKVGTVKSVIYDYTNEHPTRVVVGLDKQIRIPKGSTAEIESDLMGNVKVNLLLANNPRERVMPGETISGTILLCVNYLGIDLSCCYLFMTKHFADCIDVCAIGKL